MVDRWPNPRSRDGRLSAYAGIGSRHAPQDILDLATRAATALARKRYTLRSGHAPGMDQAWEEGAAGRAEVYLPWPTFECLTRIQTDFVIDHPTREALALAAEHHPNWGNLSRGARQLHARNCHQVLGYGLDEPALFVVCWTANGSLDGREWEETGGTGQALRVAAAHGVEVFNLARPEHRARVEAIAEEVRS